MASMTIIAKPYAKAAYEFASEQNAVDQWAKELTSFSQVVESKAIAQIIMSPMISQSEIVKATKKDLDSNFANFLALLAENNRLEVLPSIVIEFQALKNAQSNNKAASVTLAYKADKTMLKNLKASLEKRFNCSVELDVKIDESLIGGAIVRVGDTVIDDSVSGRLEKMKSILLS